MHHKISTQAIPALITLGLVLIHPLPALAQTDFESAAARFDWERGEACFPVNVTDSARLYDVCLKLGSLSPSIRFSLASSRPRQSALPGMATYNQQEGLSIPVVRLSNGKVFSNARLAVAVDSATSALSFTVTDTNNITPDDSHSVARLWNEVLLEAIRHDFARPTVHARNLFHSAVAMYDAWAVFDAQATAYLLGKSVHGFSCDFTGFHSSNIESDRATAISYAAFRLLTHRFKNSPGSADSLQRFADLMTGLNHDMDHDSVDYGDGDAAALGNYIAQCVIAYGLQDGANEANAYANRFYTPVNSPLAPELPGNPLMENPNRWQPLAFDVFRDQSGNIFSSQVPAFVSAEWGQVKPFALSQDDLTIQQRDGHDYRVYHDPGAPPVLAPDEVGDFQWNFALVAQWSSHLDPTDGVLWDISPASIGNIQDYPATGAGLRDFYKALNGGDPSMGHEINPYTGQPYVPQLVPRGDYTRVLAEYWADGPHSETPPGHWFVILNYVSDHPLFSKHFAGTGPVLDDLEWDIKSYLALGGAVHDAAVTAWSIKGWYDYVRPVSAIRHMAEKGQSSDPEEVNYDPEGMPLMPGFIELVKPGDPLAGNDSGNIGKIKLFAWRGPEQVPDPALDYAGVGWILAENWWPYQRPTFVTPPFAGYVSGHSTFSRAAAEVMTLLTGDAYFPGGLGEFHAPKNEFLVFEEGPGVDLTLQWATYRDASDQTSLSRIWGGIHPPVDDIPGRLIGAKVGVAAFGRAQQYFSGTAPP
ncbi:MAG: vanadium-dependent haloperoxidase [Pseudomonadales bacterium]|nr:vanadium-dependent haloperoxidase [Pseudomonadales bacterium]